jgi:hypothetical protein
MHHVESVVDWQYREQPTQHEASEGDDVLPRQHRGQSLVVTRQAAEAGDQGEAAL